jgi:hypothetical protein
MKILIPYPPVPLLLQEKGVRVDQVIPPTPPPERPSLSGLSAIFNGVFHKGQSPFGGGLGVPPKFSTISPKHGGNRGLTEMFSKE